MKNIIKFKGLLKTFFNDDKSFKSAYSTSATDSLADHDQSNVPILSMRASPSN